jgi:hypothetical protein
MRQKSQLAKIIFRSNAPGYFSLLVCLDSDLLGLFSELPGFTIPVTYERIDCVRKGAHTFAGLARNTIQMARNSMKHGSVNDVEKVEQPIWAMRRILWKKDANMNTKLYLAWVAALCLTLIIFSPALAEKSYLAERFDVSIAVQPDGTLNISETIVFRFTGGPYTYVFRELAFNNLDEIENIQASLDGQALGQGTQPGQVEITTGQQTNVTWRFAPTQDSVHEFTLMYQVKGAIRQDTAADTLIWRAIPAQHEYTINNSAIHLEYPAGVLPMTSPSLSVNWASFEAGSTGATFTMNAIEADTPVDITVSFPRQSLVAQPPAWQAEQQQQAQRTNMGLPFGLGAAALATLLGVVGVFLAGRSFRRETAIAHKNAYQNFSAPPRAIPPALAAKLTGSSVPFLGTLFDLARRGVLRIEEGPKKWGNRTFEVIRQSTSERMQPHEQVFLDALFKKARMIARP